MRSLAAGVVLVMAAVAGCSGGEAAPAEVEPLASGSATASAPGQDTESSPTSRSTPSVVAVEPSASVVRSPQVAVPSAARTSDSAGASAFARHYFEVINGAFAGEATEVLDALSDPGCGGCSNVLTAIDEAARAGHRVRDARLEVLFAEAPKVAAGETIVDVRYRRGPGQLVDDEGDTVQQIEAEGPIDTQLRLRFTKGAWSVLGFRQAET